jgi:hypothetical protein
MNVPSNNLSQTGLRSWQHCLFFLLACAVLISRRPDAIFHAQFWAEDGHIWISDAYNLGWWRALFQVYNGYYQTLPRLGAALALLVPLPFAPLVLNSIAILIQALPASLLLLDRFEPWGSLRFRAMLAGMYLVVPNTAEISFGITESQWLLALCAILILAALPPKNILGKAFEILLLLISGLTGPFCLVLFPFAVFLALRKKDGWLRIRVAVLGITSLVQLWALLVINPSGRKGAALGATPGLFARILGGQVYLGTLLGGNGLAAFSNVRVITVMSLLAIGGTILVAICFIKSTLPMRLFLIFAYLLFALSLLSSTGAVPAGFSAWESLTWGSAIRYWFFPTLAFAWSIVWCIESRSRTLKAVSSVLLFVMCFGLMHDWQHPAFSDMHFGDYASSFESAPAGTTVIIPENPAGWNLRLVKHSQW